MTLKALRRKDLKAEGGVFNNCKENINKGDGEKDPNYEDICGSLYYPIFIKHSMV